MLITYIYGKPHITLKNMIPKAFLLSYKSFNYREFPEINSYAPSDIDKLIKSLDNIKFKKNAKLDFFLKKFFSYPYSKIHKAVLSQIRSLIFCIIKINKILNIF